MPCNGGITNKAMVYATTEQNTIHSRCKRVVIGVVRGLNFRKSEELPEAPVGDERRA